MAHSRRRPKRRGSKRRTGSKVTVELRQLLHMLGFRLVDADRGVIARSPGGR
jgi:hypothetical protein